MYPGYIPDVSRIYPRFIEHPRIYLEYILDLSRMTDESGIHLFIPHSGIPRLGVSGVVVSMFYCIPLMICSFPGTGRGRGRKDWGKSEFSKLL
jgi:hypothetical protein